MDVISLFMLTIAALKGKPDKSISHTPSFGKVKKNKLSGRRFQSPRTVFVSNHIKAVETVHKAWSVLFEKTHSSLASNMKIEKLLNVMVCAEEQLKHHISCF